MHIRFMSQVFNSILILQIIQVADKVNKNSKNNRFLKELHNLSISNVTLEDDGYWQCEAENIQGYILNSRIIKLVVLSMFL